MAISYQEIEQLVELKGNIGGNSSTGFGLNSIIILSVAVLSALGWYVMSPGATEQEFTQVPAVEQQTALAENEPEKPNENAIVPVEQVGEDDKTKKKKEVKKPHAPKTIHKLRAKKVKTSLAVQKQVMKTKVKKPAWWPHSEGSKAIEVKEFPILEAALDTVKKENRDKIDGQSKTLVRELSTEDIEWLVLNHANGNIEVVTWDNPSIELTSVITVEARDEEDEQLALEDFNLELKKEKNNAVVENNWDKYNSTNCSCLSYKTKIKTDKGERIKVKKVLIDYTVKVPKDLNLSLKNSYGNITIPDYSGEVKARLFQGDIATGELTGKLTLSEKYGSAKISGFREGEVYLFQGRADLGKSESLDLTTKYSKVNMISTGNMELSAFQSKLNCTEGVRGLKGKASYTQVVIGEAADTVDLSMFQSSISAKQMDYLDLSSSYSQTNVQEVKYMNISKAFQGKFSLGKVGTIRGSAQYSKFEIEEVGNAIDLDMFQGKLDVDYISSSFSKVDVDGKYTTVSLQVDPEAKYAFDAETSYSSLHLPSKDFEVKYRSRVNQSLDLKALYNGALADGNSSIRIKSFQGNISLK